MTSGIYAILQLSTGKHYIGSAVSLVKRWSKHVSDLKAGKHHCAKLQNSWNKHGAEDFRFDVLETCSSGLLIEREQFYMDSTLPYFNVLRIARSAAGYQHSVKAIESMKAPRLDLAGVRFGRLVAVEVSGRNSAGHYQWKCLCDCGCEKSVGASKLKSGHTSSCGCLRSELTGARSVMRNKTHGKTKTPTFVSWTQMKSKCLSETSKDYEVCGGKGVVICERWNSFDSFLADMGERPEGKWLSRKDGGGNFDLTNCFWATPKEVAQGRKRKEKKIEFN